MEITGKKRDISIDIIKFLAVLFIINSHADVCYPKYSALATGGAIGDALFLFCSGYTLFLKKTDDLTIIIRGVLVVFIRQFLHV
jgi:peptidoglycan/LPS O-acetylase OafA/YrhL